MTRRRSIPKSMGISQIEKRNGTTEDITQSVYDCYLDTLEQTRGIAEELKGRNDYESCINIARFVEGNINYKIDPNGVQWVRTPARLFDDGQGDCKSYTIFVCSCLSNLGIDNLLRFVSYDGIDLTHVYSVAIIDGKEFPIDVVAKQLKGTEIGNELKYKYKQDMAGTTISRLSGVGNTQQGDSVISVYAGDGTHKKVNEQYLLSEIDLLQELANISKSEREVQEYYNKMDLLQTCLSALNFAERTDLMEIVGMLIAKYANEGVFAVSYDSMKDRVFGLSKIISQLKNDFDYLSVNTDKQIVVFTPEFKKDNAEFLDWWKKQIIDKNYDANIAIKGIGAITTQQLIKSVSPTLLYATQLADMDSAKAKVKQKKQRKLIQYMQQQTGLSAETIKNLISSGVIATYGRTPADVINILKLGNSKKLTARISGIGKLNFKTYDFSSTAKIEVPSIQEYVNTQLGINQNNPLSAETYYKDFSTLFKKNDASLNLVSSSAESSDTSTTNGTANKYAWVDAVTGVANALGTTSEAITNIIKEIKPITQENVTSYAGFSGTIPNTDDWTSSPVVLLAGAGLLGLGIYSVMKKKKRR